MYFTKYVPTGQKPEVGMRCRDKMAGGIFILGDAINTYPEGELKQSILDNAEPVKLVLCSEDILPEDYLVEGRVHIYHDGSHPPFKILGDISPEAKWLKEEYLAADQIRGYSYNWMGGERYYDNFLDERIGYFQIKGPSYHFH